MQEERKKKKKKRIGKTVALHNWLTTTNEKRITAQYAACLENRPFTYTISIIHSCLSSQKVIYGRNTIYCRMPCTFSICCFLLLHIIRTALMIMRSVARCVHAYKNSYFHKKYCFIRGYMDVGHHTCEITTSCIRQ